MNFNFVFAEMLVNYWRIRNINNKFILYNIYDFIKFFYGKWRFHKWWDDRICFI